jgi:hypothetical protein
MHIKSLRFKSPLMIIFMQNHYKLVIVPRGYSSTESTLNNIPSYSQYKSMSIEEKLARVRDDIARANILEESRISGFHSATAALLGTVYTAYLGDNEIFTFRCYPLICAYIFVPAQRLYEQVVYTPVSLGNKMDFRSTLGQIDYNIRANWLYGSARILGRKRYLEYCSSPLFSEIFKGLEFLARLYFVSLETKNPGLRLKQFLRAFSGLGEVQIEALWQFRCGMVHSNSLYNFHKNRIWRFGVRTEPTKELIVISEDNSLQFLEGKHFTVFTKDLIDLYMKAKAFVLEDMLVRYRKYLTNQDFFTWIRRYLSIQYLPSLKEVASQYIKSSEGEDTFKRGLDLLPYYGIVKTPVSRFYLFKLSFSSKASDLKTRFRDLFRR